MRLLLDVPRNDMIKPQVAPVRRMGRKECSWISSAMGGCSSGTRAALHITGVSSRRRRRLAVTVRPLHLEPAARERSDVAVVVVRGIGAGVAALGGPAARLPQREAAPRVRAANRQSAPAACTWDGAGEVARRTRLRMMLVGVLRARRAPAMSPTRKTCHTITL
jgi:hypothetical protein